MSNLKNGLAPGHLLKGYRIERVIGGGGFSLVYLARDLNSREKVAIKEYMPTSFARRADYGYVEPFSQESTTLYRQGIKRFFDEAAAVSKVEHPNLVRVTNFFRANNTAYMVMRYEQGRDLRWYIKRHSSGLSEKFLRTVFPPLLEGLHALHAASLLHLDVKPANIFLRPGGNPLLLDLGATQGAGVPSPTGPSTLTVGFAPLEQHNKGALGPWTDMYAIGASMLACITGRAPPPAPERATKDRLKPAARSFARRYSPRLLDAIDWCLHMDPMQRPQNVPQLLEFLNGGNAEETKAPPREFASLWGMKLPWPKFKLP